MLLGQIALAFAAKRAAPKASLGALILAALLPDLLCTVLVLAGVERVRIGAGGTAMLPIAFVWWPVSHSLLMVLVWGALAAAIYRWRTGYRIGSLVVFALVASHWLLELLSHRSDLPLAPGLDTRVGIGLGDVPAAMIALEAALFFVGVALYLDQTRPIRWAGRFGLLAMIAFAAIVFLAAMSGIAPRGPRELIAVSLVTWAFVPWGAWVDRYRVVPRRA
ncbi:MAG TPA: hypothetical protein VF363_12180 [Candidatus Eisenbacteria bacterium]